MCYQLNSKFIYSYLLFICLSLQISQAGILNETLRYDVHIWLGRHTVPVSHVTHNVPEIIHVSLHNICTDSVKSSHLLNQNIMQEDHLTAVTKANELDAHLGHRCVLHRQVEAHESALFLGYFTPIT